MCVLKAMPTQEPVRSHSQNFPRPPNSPRLVSQAHDQRRSCRLVARNGPLNFENFFHAELCRGTRPFELFWRGNVNRQSTCPRFQPLNVEFYLNGEPLIDQLECRHFNAIHPIHAGERCGGFLGILAKAREARKSDHFHHGQTGKPWRIFVSPIEVRQIASSFEVGEPRSPRHPNVRSIFWTSTSIQENHRACFGTYAPNI